MSKLPTDFAFLGQRGCCLAEVLCCLSVVVVVYRIGNRHAIDVGVEGTQSRGRLPCAL